MNTSELKEALEEILRCDRLDVAQEIAADVLGVEKSDYIDEDTIEAGSSYDFEEVEIAQRDVLSQFE